MLPVFKNDNSGSWQVGFDKGEFPIGFPVISFNYRT
jgi:hypothetical protein